MNDNIKKIGLAVIVVLILVAGVLFLGKKPVNNQTSTSTNNTNTAKDTTAEQKAAQEKMPLFVLGKVTKIEGQKITMAVGSEQKVVLVTSKTTYISQVKDKDAYKNIEAKFADVKVGTQMVVYYTTKTDVDYTADRVQILPF